MIFDVSNDKIASDIDCWINGSNAKRNREILKRRLIDGLTYEALAEEFNLSTSQITRIVYNASAKLFRHVEYKPN